MSKKDIDIRKALSVTKIPIVTHVLSAEFQAVYIIPLTDEQIGNPGFYEELFLGYRKWILERPNAFVLLPGDLYEEPVVGNKASNFWEMHLTPRRAKNKAKSLLKPLADEGRILGAVSGNHEFRAYKATGHDPMYDTLSELNLPVEGKNSIFDPDALVIRITFDGINKHGNESFVYKIYMSHGWGGARRTGAHVNKTEEMAAVVTNADVYVIGHEHTLYDSRWDSAYIPDRPANECIPIRQVFVGCGTFCRYTKFQKRIQRRLPNLGAPRIRLEGVSGGKVHKDIHCSI